MQRNYLNKMYVPFFDLKVAQESSLLDLRQAFDRVMSSGAFILGAEVERFELQFADFLEVGNAVGVSNGLDALVLALEVLGIGPGDEVIVPSNTYVASVLAVLRVGALPVFSEPHPITGLLDADELHKVMTRKTRALLPVHLFGNPVDMASIMQFAKDHKLWVVEDNAQAVGARWKGRHTGTWGHVNATSFYPTKNLGALGDAGCVTTQDEKWARKVRSLRNYGSSKKYYNELLGYNMRLDELQAAFLTAKLKHLDRWNQERREISERYDAAFGVCEGVELVPVLEGGESVRHLYVCRVKNRPELQAVLDTAGIGHLVHYPIPPHLQPACSSLGKRKGDYPVAEQWAEELISLPLWPGMKQEEIQHVATTVAGLYGKASC